MANEIQNYEKNAGSFLKSIEKTLQNYAVRKYDNSAFLKSAMIAIMGNETLAKATSTDAGKQSLYHALRFAAATGLDLNPQQGKAAIIAYNNKVQYQIMKNGMIDLAMETGKVEFIASDIVREADEWIPPKNEKDNYTFIPARKNRGSIDGFFAILKLKSGSLHCKYMTVDEITEHRKKHSPNTQMPEIGYGLKTVLKFILRSVSISAELDKYIDTDDCFEPEYSVSPVTPDEVSKKLDKKPVKIEPKEDGSLL